MTEKCQKLFKNFPLAAHIGTQASIYKNFCSLSDPLQKSWPSVVLAASYLQISEKLFQISESYF